MRFSPDYLASRSAHFGGKAVIVGHQPSVRETELAAYAEFFIVRLDTMAHGRAGAAGVLAAPHEAEHEAQSIVATAMADGRPKDAARYAFPCSIVADLLAASGFHRIVLAGMEVGEDSGRTLLGELKTIKERYGVLFSSIRCEHPSILIGAEPEQTLAEGVLKWSIDNNSILEIKYLEGPTTSRDLFVGNRAGTPFSFQRLFLPQLAGHKGRSAYFDSDMLVFRDVYELFDADMGENVLISCRPTKERPAQYSVFVVDNARAEWNPQEILRRYSDGTLNYGQIMREFCFAEPKAKTLPMEWNSLELYESGRTANCHFTDMDTQPWLSTTNPYASKWCEALFAACDQRPSVLTALELSLDKAWVRPSLKWQVEHCKPDPRSLPHDVLALDDGWKPPHRLKDGSRRRFRSQLRAAANRVRRILQIAL
jgi:hypothetical protein